MTKWGYKTCKRCNTERKELFIKDGFCGDCYRKVNRKKIEVLENGIS